MRIAFYEDSEAEGFGPLVHLRPVFDLVCGRMSLFDRMIARLGKPECGVFVRPRLADSVRESRPSVVVNQPAWLGHGLTLLVNGRWLPPANALDSLRDDEVGIVDDTIVSLVLRPDEGWRLVDGDWRSELTKIAESRRFVAAGGTLLKRPWDLVNENSRQLERDFTAGPPPTEEFEVVGPRERLWIDSEVEVDPYVVFDVRSGPISVERGAVLQAFTRIEGPCHVGRGARLFRANVRAGTTIGPGCRVGGEVENAILHARVNKYHDGFLGHAYVCPWVNLGAGTQNSDLRNDYGPVRVPLAGEPVDTGSTKVGVFIGDHSKTAIGSLFNTGSSIGVASTIVPGGGLVPRFVPSFSTLWHGDIVENVDVDGVVATARTVMSRRGETFGPAAEALLRDLFDRTRSRRLTAIRRRSEAAATRSRDHNLNRAG